jgi:hypothetical protein
MAIPETAGVAGRIAQVAVCIGWNLRLAQYAVRGAPPKNTANAADYVRISQSAIHRVIWVIGTTVDWPANCGMPNDGCGRKAAPRRRRSLDRTRNFALQ